MKYPLIWISWTVGLTTANYVRGFESDVGVLLQARTIPRLSARTNERRRGNSRSPPRQATPIAALFAEGPVKVSKNGPNFERISVPKGEQAQILSQHMKKPYVDGRLQGKAPPHADSQPVALHPLKAIASGQAATAQVSVPPKGLGVLKTTIPGGGSQSEFIPGGSEKKIHVESDTPGGVEAFASVTRPGKVNADAQR